jgi:hypothetical protein
MSALADFTLPRAIRKTLQHMSRVVLTDEVEKLGLVEPVIDHFELMLRALPLPFRLALTAGIGSFDVGAIARYGRPFSRLPVDKQEAYFAAWWHSPIFAMRQFAKGVKGLIAMGFWEHPLVKTRLEYHPERWIAEVAARRLKDYAPDIKKHDEVVLESNPLVPVASLSRKVSNGQAA